MTAATSAISRKRQVACNAILDAASQIIAEKGIDAFTISEIAKRAQINRALIYHYFQNRDNLVAQSISHILSRYEAARPEEGTEGVERAVRMHIEHPEVARMFFQMLLSGRPLPEMGSRMTNTIEALERFKRERAPESTMDPTFVTIITVLAQLSWAVSRQDFARLLEISVEEADKRFIAQLRRAAGLGMQSMGVRPDTELTQPAS